MKSTKGQLFQWTDGVLFLGTPPEIDFHSHHALELIVGLDGLPERVPYRLWAEACEILPEAAIRHVHVATELLDASHMSRESPQSGAAEAVACGWLRTGFASSPARRRH